MASYTIGYVHVKKKILFQKHYSGNFLRNIILTSQYPDFSETFVFDRQQYTNLSY